MESLLILVICNQYYSRRSALNIGQWRKKCEVDSISKLQLQIRFKQS